jgi:hypothetical protein
MIARTRKLVGFALLVGVVVVLAGADAMAHSPGYYGGYGGYGSHYDGYGPGCTYGGYYGPALPPWRPLVIVVPPRYPRIGHDMWRHNDYYRSYWHHGHDGWRYRW